MELELAEHQEFIENWLAASEEPRPRPTSTEEQQLRKALQSLAKGLKRHYDKDLIEAVIRESAPRLDKSGRLTKIQIEESIADAISTL